MDNSDKQKKQECIDRIMSLNGFAAVLEFSELVEKYGSDWFTASEVGNFVNKHVMSAYKNATNESGIVIWISDCGSKRVEAFPIRDGMFNLVVGHKLLDAYGNLDWDGIIPNENMWLKPEQFDEWLANNV